MLSSRASDASDFLAAEQESGHDVTAVADVAVPGVAEVGEGVVASGVEGDAAGAGDVAEGAEVAGLCG